MLVQQEEQITRLRRVFHACEEQQRGHVALVTGAVGSGKTSLLESFGEWTAGSRGQVMSATGSRAERGLHLGVVGQLFHSARLAPETAAHVEKLLRDATSAVPLPEVGGEASDGDRAWAPLLHGLFTTLIDLTANGPLVLLVDDVHHADPASLHCLLYVTRRLRHARIMVVFAEASTLRPPHPLFRAELLSQPHFSRIGLPPLTVDAVARLVEGAVDDADTRATAEHYVRMTGGNPLLTRALLDERAGGEGSDHDVPSVGDAFDQAVLGCLYRHEPGVRRVAQALAVLDRPASTELLGHLLDVMPATTVPAVRVLRTSGLMECDQLRHSRILRSILADMSADERRSLHQRAAEVLHDRGAEASVVAEHLVAAGAAVTGWRVPVLQDAAGHALSSGRPDVAAACLRLLARAPVDERQRTATTEMLVNARWQINPLTVNGQLTELVQTARAAGWSTDASLSAVPYLLWQGRIDEAAEAVSGFSADEEQGPAAPPGRLRIMQLLISLSHPDHLANVRQTPATWGRAAGAPTTVSPLLQAVTVLGAALAPTADNDTVTTAEQILQRHHTDDGALGLLTAPLLALLWAGRSDRAAVWGDVLLDRPVAQHAPGWRAVIRAIRAEAALRVGDLPGAEHHARAALEDMPAPAWGVAIAGPLSTLIASATESGRFAEADRWLAHPTPPGMFRTPLGLHYLAARGRHHLAVRRPHAATTDLRRCGELMRTWGIDAAGLVPWRLELARVQLSVGNKTQAMQLLQEQLRVPHGVDDRTRGRTLRLLATTAAQDHRRKLLSEAVNLLQSSGDRLELVRALGDTGQTLQRAGDSARARLLVRRAYQLAQDCGASVLAQRLIRREPGSGLPAYPAAAELQEPDDGLSDAERRVAALAAQGHTNRQISSRLFITVSTVEQHLTRVYRKLDVKRRTDLPSRLVMYAETLADETQSATS
ncbi:transcriptional regulator, LuxR family [Micromonospora sp. L5]|uniref:helix-turn-helix transcriptional regulator n=1 Tax=Micromonospora TaxID=1873 RepID=UPI0001C47311|nr:MULTISPECIES: LuxR family transcriptional regulator [Micromonospora]ADU11344.1 transcriptional regulator, LuxR family [Micromonospora sp. L5]SCL29603.1 regulatory protein, luxR family [Micromonospora aurantiaca]